MKRIVGLCVIAFVGGVGGWALFDIYRSYKKAAESEMFAIVLPPLPPEFANMTLKEAFGHNQCACGSCAYAAQAVRPNETFSMSVQLVKTQE